MSPLNNDELTAAAHALHEQALAFAVMLAPTAPSAVHECIAIKAVMTNYITAVAGTPERFKAQVRPVMSEMLDYMMLCVTESMLFECFEAQIGYEVALDSIGVFFAMAQQQAVKRVASGHLQLLEALEAGHDPIAAALKPFAGPRQ